MKRIYLPLAIMLLNALSSLAYHFEQDGIYYEIGYNDVYWVVGNPDDPYSGKVTIPDYVEYQGDRRPVDAIIGGAFSNCEHLTAVTLPQTLTSINEAAFEKCTALKSIKLPSGLTYLARRAFEGCTALEEITIPGSVGDELGSYVFHDCTSLKRAVIEEGVTQILMGAFDGCTSLESVQLPQSLRAIDNEAFEGCSNLTSLTLPKGLIGFGRQWGLEKITSITLPEGLKTFGGLPGSSIEEILLPEGITKIDSYAFSDCEKLKSVTCRGLLTYIGTRAFEDCKELAAIPHDLTEVTFVGLDAFGNCSKLVELIFSDKLTEIGTDPSYDESHGPFWGCASLRKVELGNNLKEIPQMCFFNTALREFKVPEKCEKIGARAFYGCDKLESVYMPERMKSIGERTDYGYVGWVFSGCSSLKSITVPEGIEVLESGTFNNCSSLAEIKLPSTLRHIGNDVFNECPMKELNLPLGLLSIGEFSIHLPEIKELTIPYTVTALGMSWLRAPNIEKLTFEDGSDEIDWGGFLSVPAENLKDIYLGRPIKTDLEYFISDWYVPNLERITFGSNVKDATKFSPYGYSKLANITSKALTPPAIGEFYPEVYDRIAPLVPTEALEEYKTAESWKKFYSFQTQDGLGVDTAIASGDAIEKVFNLNGVMVGNDTISLPAGVYVVKTATSTRKVIIK